MKQEHVQHSSVMKSQSQSDNGKSQKKPQVKLKDPDTKLSKNDLKEILVTSDLSRFATMDGGNRPIDMNFIHQKLLPSIKEYGYDKLNPIFVYETPEKTLAVVDGQHRLTGCRLAKSEISYRIVDPDRVADYLKQANCTKNWSTADWLNFFADPKSPGFKQDYYDLKKMATDSGMSINTLLATCRLLCKKDKRLSDYFNGRINDIIYKGLFVFPVGMKEELLKQLKIFKELKAFMPKDMKESELCNKALVQVIFNKNYTHKKMLAALEKRVGDLKPASRLDRYREQIVVLYNAHQVKSNQIDIKDFAAS